MILKALLNKRIPCLGLFSFVHSSFKIREWALGSSLAFTTVMGIFLWFQKVLLKFKQRWCKMTCILNSFRRGLFKLWGEKLGFICDAESLVSEGKLKQTAWHVKGGANNQFLVCFLSDIVLMLRQTLLSP